MNNYLDLNDYELLYLVSENDEEANNIIYEKYKPLIRSLALKYYSMSKNSGLELDDFLQEGYYGLYLALNNYTDNKDCLFYTYLNVVINSKMSNLIIKSKTNKNKVINEAISLNSYIGIEKDTELEELIPDNNALLPQEEVELKELYDKIKKLIYTLSIKDSCVLELKINGFTNASISRLLDISVNDVSYILRNVRKRIFSLKKYF